MPKAIEALEQIIAEGGKFVACDDSETPRLQDWLRQRRDLLDQLDDATIGLAGLADEDRKIIGSLIDKLLRVDAVILDRIGARMRVLGDEIGVAGRLKSFLGTGSRADAPSFVSRAV